MSVMNLHSILRGCVSGIVLLLVCFGSLYWLVVRAQRVEDLSGYTGDGRIRGINGGIDVPSTVIIDFDEFDLDKHFQKQYTVSDCPLRTYRVGLMVSSERPFPRNQVNGTLTLEAHTGQGVLLFSVHKKIVDFSVQDMGSHPFLNFVHDPACRVNEEIVTAYPQVTISIDYMPDSMPPDIRGWLCLEARG